MKEFIFNYGWIILGMALMFLMHGRGFGHGHGGNGYGGGCCGGGHNHGGDRKHDHNDKNTKGHNEQHDPVKLTKEAGSMEHVHENHGHGEVQMSSEEMGKKNEGKEPDEEKPFKACCY